MSSAATLSRASASRAKVRWLSWTLLVVYAFWILGAKALAVRVLPIAGVNLSEQAILCAFFVAHGLGYYSGREVAFFAMASAMVSNVFENLSVLTGVPFGYYYHTALAGPKLFNVPLLVTLIYIGLGYVSWMVAQVLLRRITVQSRRQMVWTAPLVAAFVFTSWDFCIDPIYGTVYRAFVYQSPGVWFGTPAGNYFGWLVTTYLFYLPFSLYVSRRQAQAPTAPSRSYWVQPVLLYLLVALGVIFANSRGPKFDVAVANGKVWNTGDIFGASTLATVFTMGFISLLALLILSQKTEAVDAVQE